MVKLCLSGGTLIIAEIGQNHNGSMSLAKELIHAAFECGADVAKFQLFDARKLFTPNDNPWYSYNLTTELSFEQIYELSSYCKFVGIEFMASAFDPTRVEWLEQLDVKRHKIASRSIFDKELIERMISTKKELIVSLGHWGSGGVPTFPYETKVSFLHCISRYPAPLNSVGLLNVNFQELAGLSDHCIGISASIAAIARGARIIEKHFTLDTKMYGPDHSCSSSPQELKELVRIYGEIRACL
jgi:sialic acid synthase SpsE